MVDVDADGDMDLLIGDDYGLIKLYLRSDEGDLSFAGNLTADGEDLDVNDNATPETVDWDLDGDLDLLVGSADGNLILYRNEGSVEEADFTRVGTITAGDEEIWLGSETHGSIADLDGDGLRDLVAGSIFGELWFYANIGEDNDPQFAEGVRLSDGDGEIWLGSYTRPELIDWEGDGDVDLVTGMLDPQVWLYINSGDESAPRLPTEYPAAFQILSSYPEPFNRSVSLQFRIDQPGMIDIDVINHQGVNIGHQSVGYLTRGLHCVNLTLDNVPNGRYFTGILLNGRITWQPVTLVK